MTRHHLGRRLWKQAFKGAGQNSVAMGNLHSFLRVPRSTLEKETSLKKGLPSYEIWVWIIMWPQMTEQVPQWGEEARSSGFHM